MTISHHESRRQLAELRADWDRIYRAGLPFSRNVQLSLVSIAGDALRLLDEFEARDNELTGLLAEHMLPEADHAPNT